MQVDPFHSPRIGGLNALRRVAVGSGKEIPYRLGGSAVSAAGRPRRRIIRRTLDPALQIDAGKGMASGKVRWLDIHQQGGIRIFPIAGAIAHAVGDDAAFLACRADHVAARAHAEGIGATGFVHMHRHLVFGCT